MNLYIYSDESGVFDYEHNDYFVFAGLIAIGNDEKDLFTRKYSNVEKEVRNNLCLSLSSEIKASVLSNKYKSKIYRSLNACHKFTCIIDEKRIIQNIWDNKKSKQRYLDYAYKIAVKRGLEQLIEQNKIIPSQVERIYFYVDEHTTATNGRYELKESLENEFKVGTFNTNYSKFFPPIFPGMKDVQLKFCDSSAPNMKLVRAADMIANKVYYLINTNQTEKLNSLTNLHICYLP